MFSYEYYNMVRLIPFVLEDMSPPKGIIRCNRVQFWFWLVLNAVVAFLYASTFYFQYVAWLIDNDRTTYMTAAKCSTIFFFFLCLLAMVSGSYLGLSINQVRKLITEKEDLVNTKIMTI